ncbi:MerR family DNA-binding transcriptional regulator [Arthrobacter sp. UCD-GKA]|uniref:MerR family DNA-binding transcriptional regulator n=1 Tax=Arthrobacter sp. UCD-GKA TaxID=1913576 RepID=UPI0026BDCA8E
MASRDRARGVYAISVAAELVGMSQQSLRMYERKGLLEPGRTEGGTRFTAMRMWQGCAGSPNF